MSALLPLLPVFAGVAAGRLLVRAGIATREQGRFLFVFSFHVCLPALAFDAVATARVTPALATLPLAAALAVGGGYLAGRLVSRPLTLAAPRLAVFLMACMIVNTGFTLPFIQARLGDAGVARLVAFDLANAGLVLTWVYAIAARANPGRATAGLPWRTLATSPPLWGFALGAVVNASGAAVPAAVQMIVDAFALPTAFLITIGIGMLLVLERDEVRVGVVAIATRLATSLLIGVAVVTAFGLDGVERAVLLTLCVAPVGFNTVTFATLEDLDIRLATGTVSLSLLASLVLVPTVLLLAA